MLARENFDSPHVWHKPGLSGYLVCLVHLVSLMEPNKPDNQTDQMNKTGWRTSSQLARIFSCLLKREEPEDSSVAQ